MTDTIENSENSNSYLRDHIFPATVGTAFGAIGAAAGLPLVTGGLITASTCAGYTFSKRKFAGTLTGFATSALISLGGYISDISNQITSIRRVDLDRKILNVTRKGRPKIVATDPTGLSVWEPVDVEHEYGLTTLDAIAEKIDRERK